ncbi:hypothetical protein [Ramlibacter sp. Leaf400]|uniref:hypothetical protein n=1 Tax=Ramlibacter sp. Leaf400 TaxID=1736365 RepID=UPI0012E3839D|nr:hypothetical protein [Ramlibacter sp. Leaf400]
MNLWLTQSKMLLAARSAMKRFPQATLIRLYELLKNSRLSQAILASTTKQPLCGSRFGVELNVIGGG